MINVLYLYLLLISIVRIVNVSLSIFVQYQQEHARAVYFPQNILQITLLIINDICEITLLFQIVHIITKKVSILISTYNVPLIIIIFQCTFTNIVQQTGVQ